MKRVELIGYITLAENVALAKRTFGQKDLKKGHIWLSLDNLYRELTNFIATDSIFNLASKSANALRQRINDLFQSLAIWDDNQQLNFDAFDQAVEPYQYSYFSTHLEQFETVLKAECSDILLFGVDSTGIYDSKLLNGNASQRFYGDFKANIPLKVLTEYDEAGKSLSYGLYTACGFHALRCIELMIREYLVRHGKETNSLKTWYEYVKALDALKSGEKDGSHKSPSSKVAAMIDRIREIDRNPLMHPDDTLTIESADSLFSLSWITISELARDLPPLTSSEIPAAK